MASLASLLVVGLLGVRAMWMTNEMAKVFVSDQYVIPRAGRRMQKRAMRASGVWLASVGLYVGIGPGLPASSWSAAMGPLLLGVLMTWVPMLFAGGSWERFAGDHRTPIGPELPRGQYSAPIGPQLPYPDLRNPESVERWLEE